MLSKRMFQSYQFSIHFSRLSDFTFAIKFSFLYKDLQHKYLVAKFRCRRYSYIKNKYSNVSQ